MEHGTMGHRLRLRIAEVERLRDALLRIEQWAGAYPAEVFPEQDLAAIDALLRANGYSMSAMHAQWARRILDNIGEIAREALGHQNAE